MTGTQATILGHEDSTERHQEPRAQHRQLGQCAVSLSRPNLTWLGSGIWDAEEASVLPQASIPVISAG